MISASDAPALSTTAKIMRFYSPCDPPIVVHPDLRIEKFAAIDQCNSQMEGGLFDEDLGSGRTVQDRGEITTMGTDSPVGI